MISQVSYVRNFLSSNQAIIRYVPRKISSTANNLSERVFLSISSSRMLGKYLLTRAAKTRVNNGAIMIIVETSVIGPNEAA